MAPLVHQRQKPGGPHVQGVVARRSYPMPEARGAAERSNPTSKERWLHGRRRT